MYKGTTIIFIVAFTIALFGAMAPFGVDAGISCSGGNCWYTACTQNFECGTNQWTGPQRCESNSVYQDYMTFTCNNAGSTNAYCSRNTASMHQQTCQSNQTCKWGYCVDKEKTGPFSTAGGQYTSQSYKQCVGSSIYWFDSNGSQQSLYQTCAQGQACSNGSCVTVSSGCTSNYFKGCINNNLYWYNSCGTIGQLHQNCSLTNQICQSGQCIGNVVYRPPAVQEPVKEPVKETLKTPKKGDLTVSISGQKESENSAWRKTIEAQNGQKLLFMITVKNEADFVIKNVFVKADLPQKIKYENQMKIDNASSDKNISSGINFDEMPAKTSKDISFLGSVQEQWESIEKVTALISSGGISESDQVEIKIIQPQVEAAALESSPFMNFLKRWYVWLIIIAILVFIFVVMYRRISEKP